MEIVSPIVYLLSDNRSLADYLHCEFPTAERVKSRLKIIEWRRNASVPDHYFDISNEFHCGDDTIGGLILNGFTQLASEYLEFHENIIYVKQDRQNDWQLLLTRIPPLLLMMAFLVKHRPLSRDICSYYIKYILPNTRYTCLPQPFVPQMLTFLKEKKGLHDLHIHLNGSTETDSVWQDMMDSPYETYKELIEVNGNNAVIELLEQESLVSSSEEYVKALNCARNLRKVFFDWIIEKSSVKYGNTREEILNYILAEAEKLFPDSDYIYYNPFSEVLCLEKSSCRMSVEGLMYCIVFSDIERNPDTLLSSLFHFYLLVLGLTNRLLVQQEHQYGFRQFQKLTMNNLRENSEKSYINRFFQLHGNNSSNICFIEGRFSPKDSEESTVRQLNEIDKGWKKLLDCITEEHLVEKQQLPELKLIAHFIKRKTDKDEFIRFKQLRTEIFKKSRVLALLKKNNPKKVECIVGIDAAGSEFDTPPEVFAPAFRYLRRNGFKHFTYHAGEDFFHLLGGLQAIYEAIDFCGMSRGDRIGHAVAAGISPEMWYNTVGGKIFVRAGEYLDNLVFSYHLIVKVDTQHRLIEKLPFLIDRIHELAYKVYKKDFAIETLEASWKLRKYVPTSFFSLDDSEVCSYPLDENELDDIKNEISYEYGRSDVKSDPRVQLLKLYNNLSDRQSYEQIVPIETLEIFSLENLEVMQQILLEYMHKKEIVIETLPTSNIRIGFHHSYTTYHLWNWIRWEQEGKPVPPIIIGTDDPGIFATNIFNEYANIYCNLLYTHKFSHNDAMCIIEKLERNAQVYRFYEGT